MNCSFCGANKDGNNTSCHYCGYVFDSEPFLFEKENFINYKIEKKEDVLDVFGKWIKKNRFVNNKVFYNSKIIEIKKHYLPVHLIKGDGDITFVYTVSKKDPNTERIIESKKRERTVSFQAKEKVIPASIYIKKKYLNNLFPLNYVDFEKKRDDSLVFPIGVSKVGAIEKAKEEEIQRQTALFSKILKGSTFNILDKKTTFNLHSNRFFYLPVLEGKYTYKNKDYTFFINAYNKKISGEFPPASGKILFLIFLFSIFSVLSSYLLLTFFS